MSFLPDTCRGLRRRTHAAFAVMVLCLIAAFWLQGVRGRDALRDAQVQGCARALADRQAAIDRDRDLIEIGGPAVDQRAHARIMAAKARVRVRCERAYPAVSQWPW